MSNPNVDSRRYIMGLGWFAAVALLLSTTASLCANPQAYPLWVWGACWAGVACMTAWFLEALVAPCPWEMERIIRRKLSDALNELRVVNGLASYFRDMSVRAGVKYDVSETAEGWTATARFPEDDNA